MDWDPSVRPPAPATSWRAVGRCEEVCVVGGEPVLRFGLNRVVAEPAVHHVGPVEEVGDRRFLAVDWFIREVDVWVEHQSRAAVGSAGSVATLLLPKVGASAGCSNTV